MQLMEAVVERSNMILALRRVESNDGSAGVDALEVGELRGYLKEHWPKIKEKLLEGSYQPVAVRRVEIAKPSGGMRQLGIPTVVDRRSGSAAGGTPGDLYVLANMYCARGVIDSE
jgi:retron-type reverse transcriptase